MYIYTYKLYPNYTFTNFMKLAYKVTLSSNLNMTHTRKMNAKSILMILSFTLNSVTSSF